MEVNRYDAPLKTEQAMLAAEYQQEMAEVYESLVAAGVVRPGERQKLDVALLRRIFEISERHKVGDAEALLPQLLKDVDPDGRTVITCEFLERIEDVAMDKVREEVFGKTVDALGDAPPDVRGFYLSLADRDAEALAAYAEAVEAGLNGDIHYWDRGRLYQWMGDARRALADFDHYLASPWLYRRPTTWAWRSQVLVKLGQTAETIQSLARAVADLAAHPNPLITGFEKADPPIGCPSEMEESDPPLTPEEREAELQSHQAQEMRIIIKAVKELDESSRVTPDLRPAMEEVKAAIVHLRQKVGL